MNTRHISELTVFIGRDRCGSLSQASTGALAFRYDSGYHGVPLSLSMPVSLAEYGDRVVRPYLMGLLPDEEATRAAIGAKYGVSGDNPFKLLAHIGGDCPGAVRVLPLAGEGATDDRGILSELSDYDVAQLLRDMQSSAAAAWTGQDAFEGRWSLGGCQAKIALCRIDGRWYRCEGSLPSTHILKPGVSGLKNQAFVEYLSMRVAETIGLPTARTSFECFEGEWAIVVERYDRVRNGGRVERVHQEDMCQALGVSPLCKYADQGGPNAPRIISLLRSTGASSQSNVYRFILYLFFNYLIGATDAHAKNHSLVYPAVGDIRLAPLYDVASIAAYQSLSPRPRKPLRAALSIGGENRFGHVGAEQIEKMVRNCSLDEIGLSAGVLVGRFRTMAEMIPPAVESEVDHALAAGLPGASEVGGPMKKEIAENCGRTLRRLG